MNARAFLRPYVKNVNRFEKMQLVAIYSKYIVGKSVKRKV